MKHLIDKKLHEIEHTFFGGFKPRSRTLDYQRSELPIRTRFSVNVRCEVKTSYVSGQRTCDSYSESDCNHKINQYQHSCINGENIVVNNTLAKALQQDPLRTATRSLELDSVKHSYSCACNQCSGRGRVS